MKSQVTLRDVAAAAGVSPMTVSNVLNNRVGAVSAETQNRVMEHVERLGYRPNATARRLRLEQTGVIGLLIVDEQPDFLRDPFTTNVAAGIGNAATASGMSVLLQGLHPRALSDSPLLSRVETDAVCVMPSGDRAVRTALLAQLRRLRQPIVLLQDRDPADLDDLCRVRQADRAGGRMIGAHLRARIPEGADIVMLRPGADWSAQAERVAGVRAALAGHARVHLVRCGDESHAQTQAALAEWLDGSAPPAAIVGGNDRMALAAISLLRARGLAVPVDVRVTGFNGFELFRYAEPCLTTVISPAYEIGARAVAEIMTRLRGGRFPVADIVLPTTFQEGESS